MKVWRSWKILWKFKGARARYIATPPQIMHYSLKTILSMYRLVLIVITMQTCNRPARGSVYMRFAIHHRWSANVQPDKAIYFTGDDSRVPERPTGSTLFFDNRFTTNIHGSRLAHECYRGSQKSLGSCCCCWCCWLVVVVAIWTMTEHPVRMEWTGCWLLMHRTCT